MKKKVLLFLATFLATFGVMVGCSSSDDCCTSSDGCSGNCAGCGKCANNGKIEMNLTEEETAEYETVASQI